MKTSGVNGLRSGEGPGVSSIPLGVAVGVGVACALGEGLGEGCASSGIGGIPTEGAPRQKGGGQSGARAITPYRRTRPSMATLLGIGPRNTPGPRGHVRAVIFSITRGSNETGLSVAWRVSHESHRQHGRGTGFGPDRSLPTRDRPLAYRRDQGVAGSLPHRYQSASLRCPLKRSQGKKLLGRCRERVHSSQAWVVVASRWLSSRTTKQGRLRGIEVGRLARSDSGDRRVRVPPGISAGKSRNPEAWPTPGWEGRRRISRRFPSPFRVVLAMADTSWRRRRRRESTRSARRRQITILWKMMRVRGIGRAGSQGPTAPKKAWEGPGRGSWPTPVQASMVAEVERRPDDRRIPEPQLRERASEPLKEPTGAPRNRDQARGPRPHHHRPKPGGRTTAFEERLPKPVVNLPSLIASRSVIVVGELPEGVHSNRRIAGSGLLAKRRADRPYGWV